MVGELWRSLARRYIVNDVPNEMAACFDCNVVHCNHGEYEACPHRLAQAAAPRAAPASERSFPIS
jgi:hypothetical protein